MVTKQITHPLGTAVSLASPAVKVADLSGSCIKRGEFRTDLNGVIRTWTEGAQKLYGYSASEIVERANLSVLWGDEEFQMGQLPCILGAADRDGKWEGIVPQIRQDGNRFNALVLITRFFDSADVRNGFLVASQNISEEMQLAESLDTEKNDANDAFILTNHSGTITNVNGTIRTFTGYDREELIGACLKSALFLQPEQGEELIQTVLTHGRVTDFRAVGRTKEGQSRELLLNASGYGEPNKPIRGIIIWARPSPQSRHGAPQPAYDREMIEASLLVYNRSLIESSVEALFAIGLDETILDVNAESTRLTGYSRKQLIGSRFSDYFTDPPRATACIHRTLREKRLGDYEMVLWTREGRRIPVSFATGVLNASWAAPTGIVAAARDISERKAIEQQLREQQLYNRSMIESNIDAMMTIDTQGILTDFNQRMERLIGRARAELIRTPFKNYFTNLHDADEAIRRVLRDGRIENYELTTTGVDGQEAVVAFNATTFNAADGSPRCIFATARDITERKRLDQALREKNDELQRVNLAKDRFLATISHELRTPLNAIIAFTGTLMMKLPGPLNAEQEKQLGIVRSSADHLLSLINDLLDLAKIESGKFEPTLEQISFNGILDEIAGTMRPLAEIKGLRFEVRHADPDFIARTDRRALKQILLNLVSNAIKFTESGNVSIEASRRARKRELMLSVIDTGVGIDPKDQARLFRSFEQFGNKRQHGEGTGLGLHVSQGLAKVLGGHITCKSEPGKGSIFSLTLPER